MTGKRFSHFETFKIALNTIYIASGFLIFGALISNASEEFKKVQVDSTSGATEYVECMNCDEVD